MRQYSFTCLMAVLVLGTASVVGQSLDEDRTKTSFSSLGSNSYRFDWEGRDGRTFIPQFSIDLVEWFYMPEIDHGIHHDPIDVTPLDQYGEPKDKYFMRLQTSDFPTLDPKNADFDGDGQANWHELTVLTTDPLNADTSGDGLLDGQTDADLDGIADQVEEAIIQYLGDLSLTIADILPGDDADQDGLTNLQEYQLGFNPYQIDSDGDGYSDRLSTLVELHLGFNESAGIIAADASGNGRNATLGGTGTWQPTGGIVNGAVELHGSGDLLALAPECLDGLGNVTISLWFKSSSSPSSQTLISAANSTSAPEFSISLESGNTVRFTHGPGGSSSWPVGRNLADGLWHHMVVVRDQTSGSVSLHLDGAQVGTPTAITLGTLAVESLVVGQLHSSTTSYVANDAFTGLIDDLRMYSYALSPELAGELFAANDLDGDLLPDDWENAHFSNLATLSSGNDDLDGDGLSNRTEYDGGTDPGDYYNGTTPVITLVSGAGQTIYNGQRTTDPLVFQVTDGVNPLVNAPVDLSHLELIGSLGTLDGDTLATSMTLRTDSEGMVSIHFKAD